MKRKWVIHKPISEDDKKKFPDIHPVVLQLLFNRGIKTHDKIKNFLNENFQELGSPFDLTDMGLAVERVLQAFEEEEKITIYADYDADAVTACAVLYKGLKQLGAQNLSVYIPDRFDEGYGVNKEALKKIVSDGTKLMITVDCGTNSVAETALANKLGLDVVITDHHEINGELPEAIAVVNYHRDNHEKLSGLTGVGTAFKLVQALFSVLYREEYKKVYDWQIPEVDFNPLSPVNIIESKPYPHWEKWLLDLVAIGTVADCQNLLGENRLFVKYGIQVLQKSRWPGLQKMLRNAGLDNGKIFDTFTLGFILAPRINAAGRIQHADVAFKLLISDSESTASQYAGQLESLNNHRQKITEQIFSEARSQAELQQDNKILLVVGEDWPKGVIGLVASRLSDEFYRPTVVLETSNGQATGSARSIAGFDMVSAFTYAKDCLDRYGGHEQAAGLTINVKKIEEFRKRITEFAEKKLTDSDFTKKLQIDIALEPWDITFELLEKIKKMQPFGVGNPSPVVIIKEMTLENLRTVGGNSTHLKLTAGKSGKTYHFIGFRQAHRLNSLSPGNKLDLVVEPSENIWNGRRDIQFKIIDLKKI